MTMPRAADTYETLETLNPTPNTPSLSSEAVSGTPPSASTVSSLRTVFHSGGKSQQKCRSYWDDLDPYQQQQCKDYTRIVSQFGNNTWAWWPAGCVLERWNEEIFPTITRIQNENGRWIFKGQKIHPICIIELHMIGANLPSARPTIVAKCADLRIAKRTILVLKRIPSFTDLNLGFDFVPCAKILRLAGRAGYNEGPKELRLSLRSGYNEGGDTGYQGYLKAEEPQKQNQSALGQRLHGLHILVYPNRNLPETLYNQATLGGVLILNGRYFGLTAAHVFFEQQEEWRIDDKADDDDEESDWEEDFELFRGASKAAMETKEDHELPRFVAPDYNVVLVHMDPDPGLTAREQRAFRPLSRVDLVGYLPDGRTCSCLSDHEGEGQDAKKWMSMQSDWALICIHNPCFSTRNNFRTPDGGTIVPSRISESPPQGDVFLATKTRRLLSAHCPGIRSGIFLPHSGEMQEVWTVKRYTCKSAQRQTKA